MKLKEKIFLKSPYFIQNSAITIFNTYQYMMRHGGEYKKFRKYY